MKWLTESAWYSIMERSNLGPWELAPPPNENPATALGAPAFRLELKKMALVCAFRNYMCDSAVENG